MNFVNTKSTKHDLCGIWVWNALFSHFMFLYFQLNPKAMHSWIQNSKFILNCIIDFEIIFVEPTKVEGRL